MTSKLTIARERLEKIKSWSETYGARSNVMLSAEEAEELARIALAAMDSEPVAIVEPSDYVTAAQLVGEGPARKAVHELYEGALRIGDKLYRHAQPASELKPVGYLFVSDQGAIAYSPTDWGMPGFKLAGQIFGDIDVESQPAPSCSAPYGYVYTSKDGGAVNFSYKPPMMPERWDIVPVFTAHTDPQPAPVVPEGLNPETTDLVLRFASALADKLYKAEQKYGRSTDWMKDDWYDDCLQSLWEHIEKGDPRDVAAYCAFMWYHGWVTTDYDRNVQNACRAAMLAAAPQPQNAPQNIPEIIPGWIPVSERMPETDGNYWGWWSESKRQGPVWFIKSELQAQFQSSEITHWMPLPAAPQEVKGG